MSRNTLKFHQLNCHKRNLSNEYLIHHNTELKNGILVRLCQEPGHDEGEIRDFDRSLKIYQGCEVNPRACIVIDKGVNSKLQNTTEIKVCCESRLKVLDKGLSGTVHCSEMTAEFQLLLYKYLQIPICMQIQDESTKAY